MRAGGLPSDCSSTDLIPLQPAGFDEGRFDLIDHYVPLLDGDLLRMFLNHGLKPLTWDSLLFSFYILPFASIPNCSSSVVLGI